MVDARINLSTEQECQAESRVRANSTETISTPSSSSEYVTGEADDSSDSKSSVPFALKSVAALLSLSKTASQDNLHRIISEDLELCKQKLLESAECSEERKWLVRRLIELRLRMQELRETTDKNLSETHAILGHHLVRQKYYISTAGSVYCDHCSCAIWTMLQTWYMCSDCTFSCHWKCLNSIYRECVHVVASEAGGYTYTRDICPEQGLSAQAYRCAECNVRITFEATWVEPRLCDYTGLYYCQRCHWNNVAVIPARVIRNWDMEPRKVSRFAAQLLALLEERPVLPLERLNPKLFTLVPDLSTVKRYREEMQMMKQYLVLCAEATNQGLPWRVGLRTHLIDSPGSYSIKDLVDLQNGNLIEEIRSAHEAMENHITKQCELCKVRGHLCEICGNNEIIYPWAANAIVCRECTAVYHRVCWNKRNHECPRCLRLKERRRRSSQDAEDEATTSSDVAEEVFVAEDQ